MQNVLLIIDSFTLAELSAVRLFVYEVEEKLLFLQRRCCEIPELQLYRDHTYLAPVIPHNSVFCVFHKVNDKEFHIHDHHHLAVKKFLQLLSFSGLFRPKGSLKVSVVPQSM